MANEITLQEPGFSPIDPRTAVTQPDKTTANAVKAGSAVAQDVIKGVQKKRTREKVQGVTQAYQLAADINQQGATVDPNTNQVLSPQGTVDEQLTKQLQAVQSSSNQAFNKINAAIQQGKSLKSGVAQTNLLIENETRKLINQFPGFEDVVRQSASDILGYDPTGFAVRQLLSIDKTNRVTEWDKVLQNAEAIRNSAQAIGAPISEKQALKMASNTYYRQKKVEEMDANLKIGAITIPEAADTIIQANGSPLTSIITEYKKTISSGNLGAYNDVEQTRLLTQTIHQQEENEVSKTIQSVKARAHDIGAYLSQDQIDSIEQKVRNKYKDVDQVVQWLDKTNILKAKSDELAAWINADAYSAMPTLKYLADSGIPDGVANTLLSLASNVSNPDQWSLVAKNYPWLVQAGFGDHPDSAHMQMFGNAMRQFLGGHKISVSADPKVNGDLNKMFTVGMYNAAGDKSERDQVLDFMHGRKAQNALKIIAADPDRAVASMSEDTRKKYAKTVGVDTGRNIDALSNSVYDKYTSTFHNITPDDNIDDFLQVDTDENGNSKLSLNYQNRFKMSSGYYAPPVEKTDPDITYTNNVLMKLANNPNTRSRLFNDDIHSGRDYAEAMRAAVVARVYERRINDIKNTIATKSTELSATNDEKEMNRLSTEIKNLNTEIDAFQQKAETEMYRAKYLKNK